MGLARTLCAVAAGCKERAWIGVQIGGVRGGWKGLSGGKCGSVTHRYCVGITSVRACGGFRGCSAMSLRDWLGVREVPEWTKARWVGAGVSVAICLIALAILFRLVVSIISPSSEGVRDYGLLMSGVIGAALVGWRNMVASRQADLQDEALFNLKINAATEDLSARRQVTMVFKEDGRTVAIDQWVDDLVLRATAIDRLEGLASERPTEVVRIARLFSTYIVEISSENPPEPHPNRPSTAESQQWAKQLTAKRSDAERALQSLSRLNTVFGLSRAQATISLRGANLQGFDLKGANLSYLDMSYASLDGAQLSRADLRHAELRHASVTGTDFFLADLKGANLIEANLQDTELRSAKLDGARFVSKLPIRETIHFADPRRVNSNVGSSGIDF